MIVHFPQAYIVVSDNNNNYYYYHYCETAWIKWEVCFLPAVRWQTVFWEHQQDDKRTRQSETSHHVSQADCGSYFQLTYLLTYWLCMFVGSG